MKHFDFILLDILCLHAAFIIAYMLRHGVQNPYMVLEYRKIILIYTMADLIVIFCYGTMKNVLKRGYYKELITTVSHIFLVEAFVTFYLFLSKESSVYSRTTILLLVIYYFIFSYGVRLVWKHHIMDANVLINKRSMLVVCSRRDARRIAKDVSEKKFAMFDIAGFVISDQNMIGKRIDGIPVVANLDTMMAYLCHEWVDEVLIMKLRGDIAITDIINQCIEMGLTVHVEIEELADVIDCKQEMEKLENYVVVTASKNTISNREQVGKRLLDILGGLAGCLVTAVLFVFIAPIIYIKSPGPIFFVQDRVGRNGKIFKMYKFRSMYMDAEERKKELMAQNRVKNGMMFKLDWDPRIIGSKQLPDGRTKKGIGNYIRDWSIDEFPQFFNVLKGDMSLVGTRPPTVDEWLKYEPHHRARLSMKPGITGLWQVSGRSNITDFEEVVRLDTEYINNWSMGRDFRILLKTVKVMLMKDGAM